MIELIEWIWFVCLLILTGYHLVIFKRKPQQLPRTISDWPGVSIVIAHKNDSKHLRQNIETIHSQDYPLFEIIIVDDHSSPSEKMLLEELTTPLKGVSLLTNQMPGKKSAITKGVQHAKYDLILCTDVDCNPQSDQWIRKMVEAGRINEVVLGYSPYRKMKRWLNLLIRFETVMTAIHYMSWTMGEKPFMGVGRNMLYPRSLFLRQDPFKDHQSIPYGDDDLMVQALSTNVRFKVCADPLAHVVSEPALTWKQWLRQKHRHLSAGHYYKSGSWLQPGIYGISLVGQWLFIPLLIMDSFWWKWFPVMFIGLFIRWATYAGWTRILGDRDTLKWYPILEINYALYLGMMGIVTAFAKKKTWN